MMTINHIVSQLNGPVFQLIRFLRQMYDIKISDERLGEIHNMDNGEKLGNHRIATIPNQLDITLRDVSFRYSGSLKPVIKNLSLTILVNKITTIIGTIGGGKITLMKLLLWLYAIDKGEISIGKFNLNNKVNYYHLIKNQLELGG